MPCGQFSITVTHSRCHHKFPITTLYLLAGAEGLSTRAAVRHTSTKDITKHGRPTQGTTLQSTPPTKICGPCRFVEPATLEPLKYHVYTRCTCHFTALRSATMDVKVTEFRGEGSGTHGIHHQVTRGGEHIPCLCCPTRLSSTATFCKTSQVEDVVSILQLRWRVPLLLKTLVLKQINPTPPPPAPPPPPLITLIS